jgi:heavy metal translocating P-type ATPase
VRWAALSLVAFLAALVAQGVGVPVAVVGALFAVTYAAGGWEPGLSGLQALRERTLDVDVLMIVAALAAAAIGQAFDGGLLIVIFATSGALEAVMTHRTAQSVAALLYLAPPTASLLVDDGERTVDAGTLLADDVVVVRPGERVPVDGVVTAGESDVDQSTLTGEPLPIRRSVGDGVLAGTLNGAGVLEVRATRPAAESVVAQVASQVSEAAATKADRQLFIETVEQRYSLVVVVVTLALIGLPLAFGAQFQSTLLRAMTFMIVASPCAVVLSTMPPLLAAVANAGRHGVLVKSSVVMERLADVDAVAFDKTGTLTLGTPQLVDVVPLGEIDADDVLSLAAAAEVGSEHPLGKAIVAAAVRRGVPLPPVAAFDSQPGRGVTATIGRHQIAVGDPVILNQPGTPGASYRTAEDAITSLRAAGHTAVVAMIDARPAAVLGLSDTVRPESRDTVAVLDEQLGRSPILMTGDAHATGHAIAGEVCIRAVHAGLLPADKTRIVEQLQGDGQRLLLIGDGVNDAPALATAHVGMAMGAGSDLALEAADAVVVSGRLQTVPALLGLSRKARRVAQGNLLFAALVIASLITVDFVGHLPLPLGVAGHEASTVIVGLNGMRLLSRRYWREPRALLPTTVRPAPVREESLV